MVPKKPYIPPFLTHHMRSETRISYFDGGDPFRAALMSLAITGPARKFATVTCKHLASVSSYIATGCIYYLRFY